MAKKKRTEPQRLLDLPVIEALSIKGWLQKDIVDHLNEIRPYKLTQQQVSYDIAQIRERWVEAATQEILESRGRVLATLRVQQEEAWRGWVRSTEPIKVTQKRITEGPQGTTKEMTERTEEGKWDKGFLDVVTANIKSYRDILGMDAPKQEKGDLLNPSDKPQNITIPADVIAPDMLASYRAIKSGQYHEFLEEGGRGSTKSSFISMMCIELLINNPDVHMLASRQVGNTMRDSVYAQLKWAIGELGLSDLFKTITNPMEITYLPTDQKIYFRGMDDVGKIKSITPVKGYIGIFWLEEADQARGPEAIRKVEQSLRGGEKMWFFKSWNTPRPLKHWINQYVLTPKKKQYHHKSNYMNVPREWLGSIFIEEAEHLRQVNPKAYANEYMGEATGLGGTVFENVVGREITDKEIKQFDQVGQGMDYGWFPDPFVWTRSHFDAARLKLYIFDEYHVNKKRNKAVYNYLVKEKHIDKYKNELVIGDSASPKDVADFREYGMNIRGAEKGPDSVDYSMKWLQGLVEIVIDPVRCPYTLKEFYSYELEQNKDGEFISSYPDRDNHSIDSVRYRTNLLWRRRGQ